MPWIQSFNATDAVPDSAAAALPEAVRLVDAACASCQPKALAVAVARLVSWVSRSGLFRFSDDEAEAGRELDMMAKDFTDGLSDLPEDLIEQAVVGIMRTHKFRNVPLVADIRASVTEELSRRRDMQRRVRSAEFVALKLGRIEPDPYKVARTPDQVAAAAAMVEAVNRIPTDIKPVPAQRSDLKQPDEDRSAAIQRVQAETAGRPKVAKPWAPRA